MADFFTVSDFLDNFRCSRTTFYREVQAGRIRLTKLGRASRIARSDAEAWVRNLPTVGGEVAHGEA